MGDNSEDDEVCKVYDKQDFFTIAVQLLLVLIALLSLYYKRLTEVPRRTFITWFLDVSKQGIGAGYAHVMNMVIASVITKHIRGNSILEDQCAWYGISYLIDTTLGLLLAILGLRLLNDVANRCGWTPLQHSGVYSGPTATYHWSSQVLSWLGILTVVKIFIYFFIWICSEPLAVVGGIVFAPFLERRRLELIFVMILFPGVMNIVYFWIADSFLKATDDQTSAHEHGNDEPETKDSGYVEMGDSKQKQSTSTPSWSFFG